MQLSAKSYFLFPTSPHTFQSVRLLLRVTLPFDGFHANFTVLEISGDTSSLAGTILHSEITICSDDGNGGGAIALVDYIFLDDTLCWMKRTICIKSFTRTLSHGSTSILLTKLYIILIEIQQILSWLTGRCGC